MFIAISTALERARRRIEHSRARLNICIEHLAIIFEGKPSASACTEMLLGLCEAVNDARVVRRISWSSFRRLTDSAGAVSWGG
jgi:hypothetical protein